MFEFNKKGPSEQTPDPSFKDPRPAVGTTTPDPKPAPPPARASVAAPATTAHREPATIGPSIHIDGHLRGEEDLFVEGQVSGTIHLEQHTLTIGAQGKVMADVFAHTIFVDGTVEGDLYGAEQVIVRRNARVRGNITSPRVSLEDGATFKGSIEMDPEAVKAAIKPAPGIARNSPPAPGGRPQQATPATPAGIGQGKPGVSVAGGQH